MLSKLLWIALAGYALASNTTNSSGVTDTDGSTTSAGNASVVVASSPSSTQAANASHDVPASPSSTQAANASHVVAADHSSTKSSVVATESSSTKAAVEDTKSSTKAAVVDNKDKDGSTKPPTKGADDKGADDKKGNGTNATVTEDPVQVVKAVVESTAELPTTILDTAADQIIYTNANSYVSLKMLALGACQKSISDIKICPTTGTFTGDCCVMVTCPALSAASGTMTSKTKCKNDNTGMVEASARRGLTESRRQLKAHEAGKVKITYKADSVSHVKATPAAADKMAKATKAAIMVPNAFSAEVKSAVAHAAAGTLPGIASKTAITATAFAGAAASAAVATYSATLKNATFDAPKVVESSDPAPVAGSGSTSSAAGLIVSGFALLGAALFAF